MRGARGGGGDGDAPMPSMVDAADGLVRRPPQQFDARAVEVRPEHAPRAAVGPHEATGADAIGGDAADDRARRRRVQCVSLGKGDGRRVGRRRGAVGGGGGWRGAFRQVFGVGKRVEDGRSACRDGSQRRICWLTASGSTGSPPRRRAPSVPPS